MSVPKIRNPNFTRIMTDTLEQWFIAAETNDTAFIRARQDVFFGSTDNFGNTALIRAASKGCLDVSMILVHKEAHAKNNESKTALMQCVMCFNSLAYERALNIVSLLSQHEARETDNQGRTALMFAASHGYTDVVSLLADKEYGISDMTGRTALMFASSQGFLKCVEVLQEYENGMSDKRGMTSLMFAAHRGDANITRALVDKESRKRNKKLETALIIAVKRNMPAVVDILAYYEDDIGYNNLTPCELAKSFGFPRCVDILQRHSPQYTHQTHGTKKTDDTLSPGQVVESKISREPATNVSEQRMEQDQITNPPKYCFKLPQRNITTAESIDTKIITRFEAELEELRDFSRKWRIDCVDQISNYSNATMKHINELYTKVSDIKAYMDTKLIELTLPVMKCSSCDEQQKVACSCSSVIAEELNRLKKDHEKLANAEIKMQLDALKLRLVAEGSTHAEEVLPTNAFITIKESIESLCRNLKEDLSSSLSNLSNDLQNHKVSFTASQDVLNNIKTVTQKTQHSIEYLSNRTDTLDDRMQKLEIFSNETRLLTQVSTSKGISDERERAIYKHIDDAYSSLNSALQNSLEGKLYVRGSATKTDISSIYNVTDVMKQEIETVIRRLNDYCERLSAHDARLDCTTHTLDTNQKMVETKIASFESKFAHLQATVTTFAERANVFDNNVSRCINDVKNETHQIKSEIAMISEQFMQFRSGLSCTISLLNETQRKFMVNYPQHVSDAEVAEGVGELRAKLAKLEDILVNNLESEAFERHLIRLSEVETKVDKLLITSLKGASSSDLDMRVGRLEAMMDTIVTIMNGQN